MKISKSLFVVSLMFALAPVAVIGCSSNGDDDGGSGGAGGEASGGDGGDSPGGKGGSASGGKGGSANGGSGGTASGGVGGTASGGVGGTASGGSGGAAGGSGGGAAGGAGGTNAGGGGGSAAVAAKFAADIAPILQAKCSGCHGGQYETAAKAYPRLMGDAMGLCAGQKRMMPGSAADSLVVKKVKGVAGLCGVRMPAIPPNNAPCTGAACLSADQIAKLESWINAGAMNN